jgi:iron(III) transport system substrate-binding protein
MAWGINPGITASTGFSGLVLKEWGEEKGMDFLRKLATQNITGLKISARAVVDQVIAGEYPLALQIVSYHASISAAAGAPAAWLKMEPVIANHNYIGLVKHAPHPAAARLFMEYALSEEGQTVFQKAGYIPANPKIRAGYPDTKPQDGGYQSFLLTPELAAAHYQEWLKIYNDLFK